jgi:hypothetical protein
MKAKQSMKTPGYYVWGKHTSVAWTTDREDAERTCAQLNVRGGTRYTVVPDDDWPADVPPDDIMTCKACNVVLDPEDGEWHQEYGNGYAPGSIFCGSCVDHTGMDAGSNCVCGEKLANYDLEPMSTREIAWLYAAP